MIIKVYKHFIDKDFNSFELFIDKICDEWYESWKITHL